MTSPYTLGAALLTSLVFTADVQNARGLKSIYILTAGPLECTMNLKCALEPHPLADLAAVWGVQIIKFQANFLKTPAGPLECKMNRYLNCAQELHPGNQSDWYGYAACVHRSGRQIEERASGGCAEERGWDKKELNDCALGRC